MGNCPACLSGATVHHSSETEAEDQQEEMVRVLRTTDNELFEFPGPVSVKDLLFGFHGFAVFNSHASFPKEPLHPDTQLKFNHVYHLKPWVKPSSVTPLLTLDLTEHSLKPLVKQPLLHPLSVHSPSRTDTSPCHTEPAHIMDSSLQDAKQARIIDSSFPHTERIQSNEASLSAKQACIIDLSLPHTERIQSNKASLSTDASRNKAGDINCSRRFSREPHSPHSAMSSPTKKKSVKKVRFAGGLAQIKPATAMLGCSPACNEQVHAFTASEGQPQKQLQGEWPMEGGLPLECPEKVQFKSASPKRGQLSADGSSKDINGVVRLRVVISKRQLTEIMFPKSAASGEQALMEKMLAPLLSLRSPHHHSQSWRPSLNQIPEAQGLLLV